MAKQYIGQGVMWTLDSLDRVFDGAEGQAWRIFFHDPALGYIPIGELMSTWEICREAIKKIDMTQFPHGLRIINMAILDQEICFGCLDLRCDPETREIVALQPLGHLQFRDELNEDLEPTDDLDVQL